MKRCQWTGKDPLMIIYHDQEWGVPVKDDHKWFEFIVLESFLTLTKLENHTA